MHLYSDIHLQFAGGKKTNEGTRRPEQYSRKSLQQPWVNQKSSVLLSIHTTVFLLKNLSLDLCYVVLSHSSQAL